MNLKVTIKNVLTFLVRGDDFSLYIYDKQNTQQFTYIYKQGLEA